VRRDINVADRSGLLLDVAEHILAANGTDPRRPVNRKIVTGLCRPACANTEEISSVNVKILALKQT
jgi:hypothetical protein